MSENVSVQPTTSEQNEREAFLKWYEATWMFSEEKIQQWKNTSVADIAEFAWQHQQKHIDAIEQQRDQLLEELKEAVLEYTKLPHSLGYTLTHANKWEKLIQEIEATK